MSWTLIMIFAAELNSAVSVVIPNLVSYEECARVEQVVRAGPIKEKYSSTSSSYYVSQCVEIREAKK